jgi:hypothetical protein
LEYFLLLKVLFLYLLPLSGELARA